MKTATSSPAHNVPIFLLTLLWALSSGHVAAAEQNDKAATAPSGQAAKSGFVYRPPNRGAPTARQGGGTRGMNQLIALAPDHVALTTRTQPALYWFITPGFRNKVRFRISETGISPPLLEVLLPPQPNGGIQRLDLRDHKVQLETGRVYEWGVLLEPFPHQRKPPLVTLARLGVQAPDPALDNVGRSQRPYLAAELGYWYDAIDWLSGSIDADAGNGSLRLDRALLLEQGGLLSPAAYERDILQYR